MPPNPALNRTLRDKAAQRLLAPLHGLPRKSRGWRFSFPIVVLPPGSVAAWCVWRWSMAEQTCSSTYGFRWSQCWRRPWWQFAARAPHSL